MKEGGMWHMIIQKNLEWAHALSPFTKPVKYLVLHHEAGNGTVERIHDHHKARGWAGIGYHLFVTKDGKLYAGRPMDRTGAHCLNYNGVSIGICFQGNFEQDRMGAAQIAAGEEAIRYTLGFYPDMKLVGHKELVATACPGIYFPLEHFKRVANEIKEDERMTGEQIYIKLTEYLNSQPTSKYAAEASKKAVASGIFKDGNRDGLVDNPKGILTRQDYALTLDRMGAFDRDGGGERK